MKKKLLAGLATGLLLAGTSVAQGKIIELALVLDGSGSMTTQDWQLQLKAYNSIFSDDFYSKFLAAGDTLYVAGYQFSKEIERFTDWTKITSDGEAADFGSLFSNVSHMKSGTATSKATSYASADLQNNNIKSDKMIIDISTDGLPNSRTKSIAAAQKAKQEGVTVNAIGIGTTFYGGVGYNGESFLNDFTKAGDGFYVKTASFQGFEGALREKLHRELETPKVPEPTTMLLMGSGLACLASVGRRRKSSR